MVKQTKIDTLYKDLSKAYSNKEYLKAKEIQKEIDFFNYGIK